MPPKSAGKKASPRKAPAKRMGSLSSFQPTLNFPKLDPSSTPARPATRKEEDSKRMPPPPLPSAPSAQATNGSNQNGARKGKGRAMVVEEDEVIEIIDSDEEDTPRKRRPTEERGSKPKAMWSELYTPSLQSELAPGKNRVERVRDWLHQAVHGLPEAALKGERPSQMLRDRVRKYRRILLVTGPAGIGKTTTVRLLARSLGIDLVEWAEGVDERGLGAYGELSSRIKLTTDFESTLSKLTSFLSRNSYAPLPTAGPSRAPRPRVLLMTSLPNLSHLPTREGFHAALLQFCKSFNASSCPLIIVHSDAGAGGRAEESWRDRDRGGLESAADLVGRDVMGTAWCSECDFLPLAPTFLNKALSRVLSIAIEDPDLRPAAGVVQLIGLSCNGDLRSAINSLQLLCTGAALQSAKKRKTGKEAKRGKATGRGARGGRGAKIDVSEEIRAALDSVTRQEQSLNLFHALGKVFYNKRLGDPVSDKDDQEALQAVMNLPLEEPLPDHLFEFERTKSMVQMEAFIPTIPVDASTFALWIHQNVPSFCTDIDQLTAIMDDFCFADLMRTEDDIWQASPQAIAYALHMTVRGTLMGLPSPVPRLSQKVTKPQFFEAFRSERDNGKRIDEAAAHMAKKVVASSTAVHDGTLAATDGLVWGGLLPQTTLVCDVIPEAIKIQTFGRRPMLPRTVQQLTLPPYADAYGYADGQALSERDVTGAEDEFGAEVAGADGMGVPESQGWELWDDVSHDDDEDELDWLKEDDIEEWSN